MTKRCTTLPCLLLTLLANHTAQAQSLPAITGAELAAAASAQIGITTLYDPAYVALKYPGGDVPMERGVCCDVVIRALRRHGVDLQKLVHEDMRAHFSAYPKNWGLKRTDRNIDHRRVPNLATLFARVGAEVPLQEDPAPYLPGDIVTWKLPGNLDHIGIVSDRRATDGTPLILHNIGRGAQEEDILFAYPMTGHYRIGKEQADRLKALQ